MPLELRKWFQIAIAIPSLILTFICWYIIHSALPASASTAHLVLAFLLSIMFSGFYQILRLFLPQLIVYVWPEIESD